MRKAGWFLPKRLVIFSFALFIGVSAAIPARARVDRDEQAALAYFNAHRYSEAAALFKTIIDSHSYKARDCYYLAVCLMQLKKPNLATEYVWKAYERDSSGGVEDAQVTNLCLQYLANVAYCKTLKLKRNVPQSFSINDRSGKTLVQGQLVYGDKGLSGQMQSAVDVWIGRCVLPGVDQSSIQQDCTSDEKGFLDVYRSSNLDLKVHLDRASRQRIVSAKEIEEEEALRDKDPMAFMKKMQEDMKRPDRTQRLVVAFDRKTNPDGSANVYLAIYPNK